MKKYFENLKDNTKDKLITLLALFSAIMFSILAVLLIRIPLDWRGQLVLAGSLFLFAYGVNKVSKARWITLGMIGISLFITTRYAWWRVTETLGFGDPHYHWYNFIFTFILVGAEFYAWITLALGYIQTAWPLHRRPVSLVPNPDLWPTVDVYIPTYNEPLEVVRSTVIASLSIDWPADKLNVYVLDDGSRKEFKEFAEKLGAGYITRVEHNHAKAGNLNHALTKTEGEYIAIFDCDHIPARSFLQVTMGWMEADDKIALLQTPHHFYSPDPFERNLKMFRMVPNEGELFYGLIQDGNDLWDATFFCGSCAVIRRTALLEVGGIAVETVTEDAHTALKLQRRGWKTAYLNIPQAAGLATENLAGHVGQRIRWARGMAQIFRTDNPLLGKGLTIWQRLCYVNAMAHFFFAVPRLIFLTAPLAYLLYGFQVLDAYAVTFAVYSLPHIFMSNLTNSRIQGKHRYSFWNEVYETALAPYILLPVLLAMINPKLGKFNVTAKGGIIEKTYFDRGIAVPYLLLWMLNFSGLIAAVVRLSVETKPDLSTIIMTSVWTLYNLVFISATIAVAREARQVRNHVRVPVNLKAEFRINNQKLAAKTEDVSDGGLRLRIEGSQTFETGTFGSVGLSFDGKHFTFPVKVVYQGPDFVSVEFRPLKLQEQANLVSILYTRADAWIGSGTHREDDRPLKSLLLVGRASWIGMGLVMKNTITFTKKTAIGTLLGFLLLGIPLILVALQAKASTVTPVIATASVVSNTTAVVTKTLSEPQAPANASGTFDKTWTLSQLGFPKGLRLTGLSNTQTAFLNIPDNELVQSATVTLNFRYSPGLLSRISQINLLVNGSIVSSWPIPHDGVPGATQTVTIPINPFLIQTYNKIGFQLIGHYTLQCEDPANSTLWADMLPTTTVHISGILLDLPNKLSLLPAPFYYKAGQGLVTVPFFVAYGTASPHLLEAAGVVASWFGVLSDYRSVNFPVAMNSLPKNNAVVFVNTNNGMPAGLQGLNLPDSSKPIIAVRTNPVDPSAKLLLVIGNSGKQLLEAAQALVLGHYATAGSTAKIESFKLPAPLKADAAPRWLSTRKPTELSQLDNASGLEVKYAGDIPFQFRLAPDLFLWGVKSVPLRLKYSYNPGPIGNQSSLVLSMNNSFSGAVGLPGGSNLSSKILEHTFEIPSQRLQPLDNSINMFFGFQIAKKGACQDTLPDSLRGTILSNSILDLAGIPHFTRLPNLALLANGGYPFTRYAGLSRTAIVMPNHVSNSAITLYLNLMGQFGAQTGYPIFRVAVTNQEGLKTFKNRNLIVIGTYEELSALGKWNKYLPLAVTNSGFHMNNLKGPFSRLEDKLPWWNQPSDKKYGQTELGEFLAEGTAPAALLEEIVSPLQNNRIALVMMAKNSQSFHLLSDSLMDGTLRSKVFGDIAIISGSKRIRSFILPAPHIDVGHLPFLTWLSWRLNKNPWLMAVLIAAGALILGSILTLWFKNKAKHRLKMDA